MNRWFFALLMIAGLGAAGTGVRAAEFTPAQRTEIVSIVREALKQDPSILRDALTALQVDESAKTDEASRAAIASSRNDLVNSRDPVAGNPNGDVTIVEFFDTRCPYCRRMEPVMSDFLAQDRNVRLVFKDLPILGPGSVLGSKALLAAKRQGAYLKMREAVMRLPTNTTMAQLEQTARHLGLDWPRMEKDMNDPAVQAQIDANLDLARKIGIQGTPAFVIGTELVPGAIDAPDLRKAVEAARHG
ncbi:MAG TPA: DsbA family protein [Rhodopila sp.]|uniref:DsbA family protein n=1 Tax=Rhodopila sp. TaxID=2480087 RepID=UPI002D03B8C7|nr:DsbA family protein [Rhodopila sp.]HVY16874.1 DsbA family protein [Rhodopila sp.]